VSSTGIPGAARSDDHRWSTQLSYARVARRLVPTLIGTYSPRYTPHRIAMLPGTEQVLRRLGWAAVQRVD
jgi:hypothetical protein